MPAPTLFFYGTLQDRDILAAVLGRPVPTEALTPAWADGHRTLYYPGELFPALIAAPGHVAEGLIFPDASPADLAALDAFEGHGYERLAICVRTSTGKVDAQYYRATISIPADAAPWTLATWQMQHKPLVLAGETAAAHRARTQRA